MVLVQRNMAHNQTWVINKYYLISLVISFSQTKDSSYHTCQPELNNMIKHPIQIILTRMCLKPKMKLIWLKVKKYEKNEDKSE
jgi:Holliday junction resolvase RusA-like endonuclease